MRCDVATRLILVHFLRRQCTNLQGIVIIGDSEDAGRQRNGLPFESIRVTCAVVMFMMATDDQSALVQGIQCHQDALGGHRLCVFLFLFVVFFFFFWFCLFLFGLFVLVVV